MSPGRPYFDTAAMWIVSRAAPTHLRDALLGDILEYAAASQKRVWHIALSGLPHILLHRGECSAKDLRLSDAFFLSAFALFIVYWEYFIAREWAWPFAKSILSVSVFSAAQTCMLTYLLLYFVLAYLFSKVLSQFGHRKVISLPSKGLARLLVLLPAIYFLLMPTTIDGSVFRLLQIVAVIAGFLCASVSISGTSMSLYEQLKRN